MWRTTRNAFHSFLCAFTLLGLAHGASIPGGASNGTFNIGILIPYSGDWAIGPAMASAVGIALRDVKQRNLLPPGYTVEWEWKDTKCRRLEGMKSALELWGDTDDLDAFIGGGCTSVCKPVALFAGALNVPYVSFGCTSDVLSKTYDYPTFTRAVGTWIDLAPMFPPALDAFGWDRIVLVSTSDQIMQLTANAIEMDCETHNITVTSITMETTWEDDVLNTEALVQQKLLIHQAKQQAHVFILLMYDLDIQTFLLSAHEEGLMNGTYVFMAFDADKDLPSTTTYKPDLTAAVYEGLISANLRIPSTTQYQEFAQKVIYEFQNETKFENEPKLSSTAALDEVDVHAGYLHDAILMWAYGVSEAYVDGASNIDDGLAITAKINSMNFNGITGKVSLNEQGDRAPDYSIAMWQDGVWIDLLSWIAADAVIEKVYAANEDADNWDGLKWSGNATTKPTGQPGCGWDGELCQPEDSGKVVKIAAPAAVVGLLVILGVAGFFVIRHMRFEAELKTIAQWKVNWSDIQSNKLGEQIAASRATLRTNKTYASMASGVGHGQKFIEMGTYKGKNIAIKCIDKSSVNIHDRDILIELKEARDMQHENINQFCGAVMDAPHVSVLFLYAVKGSLQDVLQNESMDLTWDFKIALATDIAKGMHYIHQSPIGSHGHLTSSNCVIDSRWTCKITDYGLGLFKAGARKDEEDEYRMYADQLWTAPELLRMSQMPMYGTPKADMYSYGIILQEIVVKDGPYALNEPMLEAKEIVDRVRAGGNPPFRPIVPSAMCGNDWTSLMADCWGEHPEYRINFSRVRTILREINGGKTINVIDNMIKMLEQHAEHLEELVAERTAELQVEKQKVETLLYNILPRTVADALKQGKTVDPEAFDCVTIYFSDIVGFTGLAARSSPLEIVTLLNDLYSTFDEVVENYDVYKVETIGDAYMVVSGLPIRNGEAHASEIASMSLHLMSSISNFKIHHMPNDQLQLRVGMHTGPCVAGVVGLKMPRYCLFGDTVNTASRMESSSFALRIHMSSSTADILQKVGGFHLDLRGEISVKGKAPITTYWLTGKDGFDLPLPDMSKAISIEAHSFK